MSDPKHRWAEELKDSLELLRTIRDELRVQVHLAGMETKARFATLEKQFDKERLAMRRNIDALIADFRQLKEDLTNKPPAPP